MTWTPRRTGIAWIPFSRYYVKCSDCHRSGQRVSNTGDWKAWHIAWHADNGVDPVGDSFATAVPLSSSSVPNARLTTEAGEPA